MATASYNLQDMMARPVPSGAGMRVGIVVSEWNSNITEDLLSGCIGTLKEMGVKGDEIVVHSVPGSFELIFASRRLAESGLVDAVIAIGCIIRGDTPHFEYISQGVTQGLSELNLRGSVPVVFGLLTTNNIEQAEERSGGLLGNKGSEYALTAIKMIDFARSVGAKQ